MFHARFGLPAVVAEMANVVVIMRTGVTAREVEKDRTECYEYQNWTV